MGQNNDKPKVVGRTERNLQESADALLKMATEMAEKLAQAGRRAAEQKAAAERAASKSDSKKK